MEVVGRDVMPDVRDVLKRMRASVSRVRAGGWKGYKGDAITDVVNIGIGGSDLGPVMVTEALKPYCGIPRVHFVSNVDGAQIAGTLQKLSPETTLFVIASKTFTTQETLANAERVRNWMTDVLGRDSISRQFVAMSASPERATAFGIAADRVIAFHDWVGGRYSLWSAVGLSIAIGLGPDAFDDLLAGEREGAGARHLN